MTIDEIVLDGCEAVFAETYRDAAGRDLDGRVVVLWRVTGLWPKNDYRELARGERQDMIDLELALSARLRERSEG